MFIGGPPAKQKLGNASSRISVIRDNASHIDCPVPHIDEVRGNDAPKSNSGTLAWSPLSLVVGGGRIFDRSVLSRLSSQTGLMLPVLSRPPQHNLVSRNCDQAHVGLPKVSGHRGKSLSSSPGQGWPEHPRCWPPVPQTTPQSPQTPADKLIKTAPVGLSKVRQLAPYKSLKQRPLTWSFRRPPHVPPAQHELQNRFQPTISRFTVPTSGL